MTCYIKEILIFNENGNKRNVPLTPGLNIITGDSKTGKSALIEIVDYCLCSKSSNIPHGIISEFGYLFSIVLSFEKYFLIIGRKSFNKGGNSKVYIKVELNESIIPSLDLNYFENIPPVSMKNIGQLEIERHLGMSFTEMGETSDSDKRRGKASLRNMTPFLFQHQNLIANKHALFYRFDDFNKRKDTIDGFPVFIGWSNDEYYQLKRAIDDKKKNLRQIELSIKKKHELNEQLRMDLIGYYKNYYSIIGKTFDDTMDVQSLIKLRERLPDFSSRSFISPEISIRYNNLTRERDEKSFEFKELSMKIKNLEESQAYADEYNNTLNILDNKSKVIQNEVELLYICPICEKPNDEILEEIRNIRNSKVKLETELKKVSTYSISYFPQIASLSEKREKLRSEINSLSTQINELKNNIDGISKQKDLEKNAIYAKARLDFTVEQIEKERNIVIKDETDELKGEIEILEKKLDFYNLKNLYKKAEAFLSQNMNKICEKLDFEEELKPINLWFEFETFNLYHTSKAYGKIGLSEMGSGANWLACHISLFLSLLHLFVKEKKSIIPNFLFLDQPSQIYFPRDFDTKNDENVKQVKRIYLAIIDELEEIENKYNFLPQVIITDHADNLDLGKYDFNKFVRKRWLKEKNQGLI